MDTEDDYAEVPLSMCMTQLNKFTPDRRLQSLWLLAGLICDNGVSYECVKAR